MAIRQEGVLKVREPDFNPDKASIYYLLGLMNLTHF